MFSCCPLGPSPLEAREYDENATATGAQKVLDQCYALAWLQLQLLQTRTDPKKAFRALGRPSVPPLTPGTRGHGMAQVALSGLEWQPGFFGGNS